MHAKGTLGRGGEVNTQRQGIAGYAWGKANFAV